MKMRLPKNMFKGKFKNPLKNLFANWNLKWPKEMDEDLSTESSDNSGKNTNKNKKKERDGIEKNIEHLKKYENLRKIILKNSGYPDSSENSSFDSTDDDSFFAKQEKALKNLPWIKKNPGLWESIKYLFGFGGNDSENPFSVSSDSEDNSSTNQNPKNAARKKRKRNKRKKKSKKRNLLNNINPINPFENNNTTSNNYANNFPNNIGNGNNNNKTFDGIGHGNSNSNIDGVANNNQNINNPNNVANNPNSMGNSNNNNGNNLNGSANNIINNSNNIPVGDAKNTDGNIIPYRNNLNPIIGNQNNFKDNHLDNNGNINVASNSPTANNFNENSMPNNNNTTYNPNNEDNRNNNANLMNNNKLNAPTENIGNNKPGINNVLSPHSDTNNNSLNTIPTQTVKSNTASNNNRNNGNNNNDGSSSNLNNTNNDNSNIPSAVKTLNNNNNNSLTNTNANINVIPEKDTINNPENSNNNITQDKDKEKNIPGDQKNTSIAKKNSIKPNNHIKGIDINRNKNLPENSEIKESDSNECDNVSNVEMKIKSEVNKKKNQSGIELSIKKKDKIEQIKDSDSEDEHENDIKLYKGKKIKFNDQEIDEKKLEPKILVLNSDKPHNKLSHISPKKSKVKNNLEEILEKPHYFQACKNQYNSVDLIEKLAEDSDDSESINKYILIGQNDVSEKKNPRNKISPQKGSDIVVNPKNNDVIISDTLPDYSKENSSNDTSNDCNDFVKLSGLNKIKNKILRLDKPSCISYTTDNLKNTGSTKKDKKNILIITNEHKIPSYFSDNIDVIENAIDNTVTKKLDNKFLTSISDHICDVVSKIKNNYQNRDVQDSNIALKKAKKLLNKINSKLKNNPSDRSLEDINDANDNNSESINDVRESKFLLKNISECDIKDSNLKELNNNNHKNIDIDKDFDKLTGTNPSDKIAVINLHPSVNVENKESNNIDIDDKREVSCKETPKHDQLQILHRAFNRIMNMKNDIFGLSSKNEDENSC
ncbi:hypothetical protein EDEG_02949 [Edhazardia aedis USNM 41457]|uniref:Uncharacterized protein n=1 Tax=Edhazardia aedis (strain USNM 41457) TaxID=1003232 RepID=J9DMT5_EDHAE|nr:hypothetical protein EDEG_02949 [Edhazardia aedis USNM 41457]|eukprot:EJW02652.1 hypothetical protein EDEG_02949 [Edhazardia aedis USNM 41457]